MAAQFNQSRRIARAQWPAHSIASSSTSNTSTLFGGIRPGMPRAVGRVRRAEQSGLAARAHFLQALRPAGDHPVQREDGRLPVLVGTVEFGAVHAGAAVMHLDRVVRLGAAPRPGFSCITTTPEGSVSAVSDRAAGQAPVRASAARMPSNFMKGIPRAARTGGKLNPDISSGRGRWRKNQ